MKKNQNSKVSIFREAVINKVSPSKTNRYSMQNKL